MNTNPHVSLLSRVIGAALIGALLGLLDFVLFELQGNHAGFREYVLYKPSLFGLSLLSFQLLAFAALGILSFCCFSVIWFVLAKLIGTRRLLPLLPQSSAALAIGTIALRVYTDSQQVFGLSILVISSAGLVLWTFVLESPHTRPGGSLAAKLFLSPSSQSLVLFILIVVSFVSPDVYSGLMRVGHDTRTQEEKGPNVLFIVLDAVRADHLSCYGYGQKTTPNIDRISHESVLFANAFSAAPWTLPSHASMFTGLYPSQHKADWGHVYLDAGFPTLAEKLRDVGYQTVGFSENVFVGRSFGLARGFGEFHDTWRRPLVVRAIARVATRVLGYRERLECAERSVGLLERWVLNNSHSGKPFFAFVNLMAAHLPRYPRSALSSRNWTKENLARIEPVNLIPERYYLPKYKLSQQELAIMSDIYDGEISYLDSHIGDLISFLAKAGILDKTIVILTSDHGENFGEHELIEHQFCLYNTLLHVPLIMRYPPVLKRGTVDKKVSTVFLSKTILSLVEVAPREAPEGLHLDPLAQIKGQDLVVAEFSNGVKMLKGVLGAEGVEVDFSRFDKSLRCVIQGDYKFIWSSNGQYELYRMREDFGEIDNLIAKKPEQARIMDQLLLSWELSAAMKNPVLNR